MNNQWKNREPIGEYAASPHTRSRALKTSDVIYTLHIPSFSNDTNGLLRTAVSHPQAREPIDRRCLW